MALCCFLAYGTFGGLLGTLSAKDSILDFNLQVGANTTLSSITDYATNMKKLADGITALDKANKAKLLGTSPTVGKDLENVIGGYNGAAEALGVTLANLRFGASFQFGFKPVRKSSLELALGVGSGLRMGGLENFVDAAQGSIIFFDIPIQTYVGLTLFKILRIDGIVGLILSASSQDLANFTAQPVDGAKKGAQLIQDGFNSPKLDLILRASVSMFYLELNGAINLEKPDSLSFFRMGLGVNIDIL